MTDVEEVFHRAKELAAAGRSLRRVKVQSGEVVIELEWPEPAAHNGHAGPHGTAPDGSAPDGTALDGQAAEVGWPAGGGEDDTGGETCRHHICAPLVGTFYHAGEPGAPPFVRPGDVVEPGQQVGILEAMKLLNPIEAEQRGRVVEVLVPNATSVEYGQPLLALVDVDADAPS